MTLHNSIFTLWTRKVKPGLLLDYEDAVFGPQPAWSVEPNVEVICVIASRSLAAGECEVEYLAEGSINKVYSIKCKQKNRSSDWVLRVALPVYPSLRTLSEVATIEYVWLETDLRVPRVHHFDASFHNELGFEWIIQDRVSGETLETKWHDVSWMMKDILVRKVIDYLSKLFGDRFDHIGSLYAKKHLSYLSEEHKPSVVDVDEQYCLGDVVSLPFFVGNHLTQNISRGPFKSSQHWLAARLQVLINDTENLPPDAEEYDIERATNIKPLALRLLALLPKVFPETDEEFVLHNHDLNTQNIIVDTDGKLKGVVDWECIHTAPLWFACQLPEFLRGRTRHELPTKTEFLYKEEDMDEEVVDEMYYQQQEEYEKTCLRRFFFEEMNRVQPEWVKIFKESELKADFERAVEFYTYELLFQRICAWVQDVEQDQEPSSLKDAIRN
ncbi:kinase-like domain-containing protein [Massariosphaeria phaeospora]|uniref:Kinase-like domain-containing protein n=1 Tax=Massariosphaeria phaeospora TaxID=100035 RepID=A0A7C8I324_9PLEO|nr:kinase-like domain-containing protein [Massariosphaeria phaeospora]